MITLSDFDPEIVARYRITPRRLEQALRYVRLMGEWGRLTLRDIAVGGYYGTAALLHEIVELDALLSRDRQLLGRSARQVRLFLNQNPDAHVQALIAEYTYLRRKIRQVFGQDVPIGALVQVNASRSDVEWLIESDAEVPIWEPTAHDLENAARWLSRLRELGKEMPR